MAPIITLILGKILDYFADHADEIIDIIKEEFLSIKDDSNFKLALTEFGYDPTEEKLNALSAVIDSKGEDSGKLASLLVTKTIV